MSSFSEAVRNSAKELRGLKAKLTDAYQGTLNDIGESLVYYTPFDTGLASSNWNAKTPSGTKVPERPVVEGIKGEASITAIYYQTNDVEPGGYVTFYNPVDYIDDLERGTSRQAPGGMVIPTKSRVTDLWLSNLRKQKII